MGTIESMNLGSMIQEKRYKPRSFRIVDDKVVEESDFIVNEFVADHSLDSNSTLSAHVHMQAWLQTDPGQWVLEHCVEEPYIMWHENLMYSSYTYRIIARLCTQDQTFFVLKYK